MNKLNIKIASVSFLLFLLILFYILINHKQLHTLIINHKDELLYFGSILIMIFVYFIYKKLEYHNRKIELSNAININELLNETQALAKVGSFKKGIKHNYFWFSKENYRIWGIEEKIFINTAELLKKIDSNDKELFLANIENSSLKKGINKFQFRINVNGNIKYIESILHYEKDEKGKIVCIKGTHQDISKKIFFLEEMQKLMKENETYKNHLEDKVKEQIREIKGKNDTLLENNKKVALGEMLANIAHQWKQPLTLISTTATAAILKKEGEVLSDRDLYKHLYSINENTQYLSTIIDTFKIFIHNEKVKKVYNLQDNINSALLIVSSYIKDQHIELKTEFVAHEIKLELIEGELIEVIINIINNARDILLERKVKNPWIKISLRRDENNGIVTIEDNGGGINNLSLVNNFDQQGIGLKVSNKIVSQSIGGKLYAQNSENGAQFIIELPLNK